MAWKVNNEGYRYQWRSSDRKKLVEKYATVEVVEMHLKLSGSTNTVLTAISQNFIYDIRAYILAL